MPCFNKVSFWCGMWYSIVWYHVIVSLIYHIIHIYRPFQMNEFLTCSFALDLTSTEVESATLTATWALDFGGHFRIYMWPVACLLWWRNLVCVAMRSDFSSCLQQVCQPIFLLMWWLKETGSTTLATPSFRCSWSEMNCYGQSLWKGFAETGALPIQWPGVPSCTAPFPTLPEIVWGSYLFPCLPYL